MTVTTSMNGALKTWNITVDMRNIPTAPTTTDQVYVTLKNISGNINNVSGPYNLVAYATTIKTGITGSSTNLTSLLCSIASPWGQGYKLEIFNANDQLVSSVTPSTLTATGMKLVLIRTNDNMIMEVYHVVLFGDIDGNGQITMIDSVMVGSYVSGTRILSGVFLLAADVDHNGLVNSNDTSTIATAGTTINQDYSISNVPDACVFNGII